MFGQGQGCNVQSDPSQVAPGKAILTDKNTLNVHGGDKIRVKTASKTFFVVIERLAPIQDLRNRDNILLSSPLGSDTKGFYKRVSSGAFLLHKISGTNKVRWSIAATVISILSAAAASMAAASKDCHEGWGCIAKISPLSWSLIGIAALSSIVAWCKDNEIF
jgi:hypothetical protein